MTKSFSNFSVIMMWGVFITLVSVSAAMSAPKNTTEALENNPSKNDTLQNPIFVGASMEGNSTAKLPAAKAPAANSTGSTDNTRTDKQYYSPYGGARIPYSALVAEGYFNPFPNYYPSRLGGVTGPGNTASSCAYAYPNRRYSCLGLGRRK